VQLRTKIIKQEWKTAMWTTQRTLHFVDWRSFFVLLYIFFSNFLKGKRCFIASLAQE
jgi:hypothetical protein